MCAGRHFSICRAGVIFKRLMAKKKKEKKRTHLVGDIPRDERHPPLLPALVQHVQQAHELVAAERRANFDPDRIADPAEVLDVGACELARAVADPEEVRRGVVVRGRRR
jgi:hypothetical protein